MVEPSTSPPISNGNSRINSCTGCTSSILGLSRCQPASCRLSRSVLSADRSDVGQLGDDMVGDRDVERGDVHRPGRRGGGNGDVGQTRTPGPAGRGRCRRSAPARSARCAFPAPANRCGYTPPAGRSPTDAPDTATTARPPATSPRRSRCRRRPQVQPGQSPIEGDPHRLAGRQHQPRDHAADGPPQRRAPAGRMCRIDHARHHRARLAVVHAIENAIVRADCTPATECGIVLLQ